MDFNELGERLRAARERAGLTQEAAADAAGFNRVVLAYYEGGQRQPSLAALSALAMVYGLTVSELLEGVGETSALDPAAVLFRAAPETLGEGAKAAARRFSSFVQAYLDLLRAVGEEPPGKGKSRFTSTRARASRSDAARLAREVRDFLAMGSGPVGDLFRVVDEHVLVFRLPLGDSLDVSPSGFFYNHPAAGFCISVNSDTTLGRQAFTLAHELAHAFFHSQDADAWISFAGSSAARERFADWFAGELLVPADGLARAVEDLGAWEDLADPIVAVQLQRHFGVSYATLLVRLSQERLITPTQYERLREVSPSKLAAALGYEVPRADMGDFALQPLDKFPDRMLSLVRSAIGRGAITRGDAAETLGVSLEDILVLLERPRADEGQLRALRELEQAARLQR